MNKLNNVESGWQVKLILILLLAIVTRIVFYTGIFGSDEMTYNKAALNFMYGEFGNSSYSGAIRYGINIPVAFFFSTFGVSEFSANLWSFLCSVAEIVVVFLFTKLYFDKRTALIAAFILATIPIHIHLTGRMAADTPLSFFLALSFYFFALAERHKNVRFFFYAGLAFGCTYWIKSIVPVLFSPIFIIYALSLRKYEKSWNWFILGGILIFLGHCSLMWVIHDNPFHMIHARLEALERLKGPAIESSFWLYLEHIFFDIRYTWILGPAAIVGVLTLNKHSLLTENRLLVIWLFWALLILSLIPLRQNNYMLMFCFPLSVFCAYCFSKVNSFVWVVAWLPVVLILSGLKQQDIRNVVSNSQALYQVAVQSPDTLFIASQKGINIYSTNQLLQKRLALKNNMLLLEESLLKPGYLENTEFEKTIITIDEETLTEGSIAKIRAHIELQKVCFEKLNSIQPQGFGVGLIFLNNIIKTVDAVTPNVISTKLLPYLSKYSQPKPMSLHMAKISCLKDFNSTQINQ